MAKVKGPLFGFRAQGKIKKEYIFQDHPHWKICKKYQVAPNPRTPSQIEIRNTMQGLIKEWQKLTDTEKEAWNDYCNKFYKKTQSGYSLFLKLNFDYYRETGKVNKYPPGYAPPGPIQEGLVAWFKLDEGQGTTITDSVNNLQGTLYNTQWTEGHKGTAIRCTGTKSYGEITHNTLLNFSTGLTIEIWVKIEILGKGEWIIIKGITSDFTFQMRKLSTNQIVAELFTTTAIRITTTNTLQSSDVGKFIQIVITYDNNYFRLYKDTEKWGEISATGSIKTNTRNIYIGQSGSNTYFLTGSIDELRFYNRALTEDEIQHNYNL